MAELHMEYYTLQDKHIRTPADQKVNLMEIGSFHGLYEHLLMNHDIENNMLYRKVEICLQGNFSNKHFKKYTDMNFDREDKYEGIGEERKHIKFYKGTAEMMDNDLDWKIFATHCDGYQQTVQSPLEEKKYDHRLLGAKQELFFCHPLSTGSWFFLPYGTRIYEKLKKFIENQYWKRGYQEVITPNIYNMKLLETSSGNASNHKENMFTFEIDKHEFGLKSMNGHGHCLMFAQRVRSYRELPLRLADFGVLHRNEASDGDLTGLTQVRRFQQDDAHIFCRESQIKDEVKSVLEFIKYAYDVFGFTFELELSTRQEKYPKEAIETWEKAEAALIEALEEFGKPWQINEADGAFYGPTIDISVFDAFKRKFQCATLQLDFQLPAHFKLSYSTEDEKKMERPVMIHSAILGSVEHMLGILLEHYKGKWPFWLSPHQAIVCSVSEKSQPYALQVRDEIHKARFYVDVDKTDRKIQEKVREARLAEYNYILVVDEEEANKRQVSVHFRDKADHSVKSIKDLLAHFKDEASSYH